jgi:hypothetical protein
MTRFYKNCWVEFSAILWFQGRQDYGYINTPETGTISLPFWKPYASNRQIDLAIEFEVIEMARIILF